MESGIKLEEFEGEIEIEFAEDFDPNKVKESKGDPSNSKEVEAPQKAPQSEKSSGKEDTKNKSSENMTELLEESLRAFTDEAYKSNENRLFGKSSDNLVYLDIPKFDLNRCVMDYKQFLAEHRAQNENFQVTPKNLANFNKLK